MAKVEFECGNLKTNQEHCTCSAVDCDKHGRCCECLRAHLSMKQLPGCCFPAQAEKAGQRSFAQFVSLLSE